MSASYPSAAKTFTTRSNGQSIDASHIDDLQDEVRAIEVDLIAGVPVARGGTGLLTGTSGGVLAYTAAGVLASSAALGANALVLGGGAGVVPFTESGFTIEQTGHSLSSTTQPRASAFNNAALSIASGSFATATLNSEDYDVGSVHNTGANTSRMTVPAGCGGIYRIRGSSGAIGTSAATKIGLQILKNGATTLTQRVYPSSATVGYQYEISFDAVLAAGDYVELQLFQDSGGNINFGSATRANSIDLQLMKVW